MYTGNSLEIMLVCNDVSVGFVRLDECNNGNFTPGIHFGSESVISDHNNIEMN